MGKSWTFGLTPSPRFVGGKIVELRPWDLRWTPIIFHCASYCLWQFSLSLTIRKVSLCSSSLTFPQKSLGETFDSPYPAQDLFEALTSRYDLWTLEVPHYYFIAHIFLVDTRCVSLLDRKLFISFFTNFGLTPSPRFVEDIPVEIRPSGKSLEVPPLFSHCASIPRWN